MNAVNGVYVYSEDRVVDINGRKINLVYFLEDLKNLNNIFNMGLDKVYLMGPRIKDGKKFNNRNWTNIETIINKAAKANNSIANYIEHTAYNNPDIDFKQDGRAIRSMQNIGLFDQNQYNAQSNTASAKYTDMWIKLYNSYRMLKYINIDFSKEDAKLANNLADEIADYINMVDSI